ncbi:MAG: hypothetical protein ACXWRZ_18790 [Bdellovibrio sp.]
MNTKLSALLTTAIVTGLLAATTAKAENAPAGGAGADTAVTGKDHACKGEMKQEGKDAAKMKEHSCGGKKKMKKNACSGKAGCKGEAKAEEKKGE